MKKWFPVFLSGLMVMGGCSSSREKKIKVAVALPLTGDIAPLGQGLRRAVQLAAEEARPTQKWPIEWVDFDDRSDPKEAVNVANRIVADPDFVAVIGHFNSGCSIPASALYAQAGLPMIGPAASNPELTRQQLSPQWNRPRTIFRLNTTDDVQGSAGADYFHDSLKLSRVSVVHDKTAYGQGVAEEFKKRFEVLGGTVTAFDGLQVGDKDFKSLVTRLKSGQPEGIYFGGIYNEGGLLLRQCREGGLKVPFLGAEANYDMEFIRIAGSAAEGATVTFLGRPAEQQPTARVFLEKYRLRYPQEELKAYDPYGYDCAGLLLEALDRVGPDRQKIVEYLRSVRYVGAVGETRFDEKGDTLNKTVTLLVVRKGHFEPVTP